MPIRVFIVIVLSIFFAGCMNKSPVMEPFVVDGACSSINIKPDQTVIIHLKSNPTTGYQWVLKKQPSFLKVVSADIYQQNKHSEGMVGVGGQTTWSFQAVAKGSDSLILVYQRPWEKQQTAETFECIVNVN